MWILQARKRRCPLLFLVLPLMALLLAQMVVGCGSPSQAQVSASSGTPPVTSQQTTQTSGPQATSTPAAVPTGNASAQTTPTPQPTSSSLALHGPTNFLLDTPFTFSTVNGVTTDDNGATTSLNTATVKTQVTQELHHLLFVVDSSDNIKVYSQGASPVAAQLGFNSDGTANISYIQTANSEAGTISILFGALLSTKQIEVHYEQQYTPSMLINAQSSDIQVAFTASVKWVAPRDIPAAPSNGTYQMTSQGGIALSWSAGQNAVAYDVYRQISDQDQQFQLLATVKGTSYNDNSSAAITNIHATKGIVYAIFSVGPTGVENPGGIIISV